MKLIINADDFGLTRGVNLGIIDAHKFGVLTSTTLMTNMSAFLNAVQLAKENPRLGVGIHLVLSAGKPVTKNKSTLTDDDGNFYKLPQVMENSTNFDQNELEEEFIGQIEKARKEGINITHFDSHHHVHGLKGVYEVVAHLAKKYDVPLRGGKNPDVLAKILQSEVIPNVNTTSEFLSGFYGENVSIEWFYNELGTLKCDSVEVMCHPAYVDYELATISRYNNKRYLETHILTNPELKNWLSDKCFSLVTFNEI